MITDFFLALDFKGLAARNLSMPGRLKLAKPASPTRIKLRRPSPVIDGPHAKGL
jgi:hypothetical protein